VQHRDVAQGSISGLPCTPTCGNAAAWLKLLLPRLTPSPDACRLILLCLPCWDRVSVQVCLSIGFGRIRKPEDSAQHQTDVLGIKRRQNVLPSSVQGSPEAAGFEGKQYGSSDAAPVSGVVVIHMWVLPLGYR
jgi:hypothetical protein